MKPAFFLSLCLLSLHFFSACNQQPEKQASATLAAVVAETEKPVDSNFIVTNPSLYGESYLKELRESKYARSYKLNADTIILNEVDTNYFPLILRLGETVEFSDTAKEKVYTLLLKQRNYTTLEYRFSTSEKGNIVDKFSGEASLPSVFFLGAETDEDENGLDYLSSEYSGTANDCTMNIRIGHPDSTVLSARIILRCANTAKNISLENSPRFRKKLN